MQLGLFAADITGERVQGKRTLKKDILDTWGSSYRFVAVVTEAWEWKLE